MSSSDKIDVSILAFAIGAFAGLTLTAVSRTAALVAIGLGAVVALSLAGERGMVG